jgi:hypothetical protein
MLEEGFMPQAWGKVKIPAGKKIAVNLGCDFDAQSLWICLNRTSPAYMPAGPHPGNSRTVVPDRFFAGRVHPRLSGGDASGG